MNKFFSFLIILLLVAGIAGFIWRWQSNIYSKEILRLEILGLSEITLGQEVEYIVRYKNNGNFRLDNPELIFEPPEYSFKEGEIFERQVLGPEKLGEAIYPGEEKTFSFKMTILGKQDEIKIARVSLTYQPKDLKAQYESSSSFTSQIKSVPLTLEFDLPSKVAGGKDFIFRINYFSNADYLLTDLRCQIEYPFSFEFINSLPKSIEKTEWDIPVLNKSEGGRIEITGKLSGEVGEARVFKAKLGVWKQDEFILLKEIVKGVEIVRPFLYLRQEINGNPQHMALPGDWLHYEIYFKNIGEESLNNLFMVNNLEGEAFDFETIKSDLGNYQAGDSSVVFDWRKVSKLQYLIPLEEGKVEFWIKLKDDLGNVKNSILRNKIFIGEAKEEFITRISSKMEIIQKGYFQDEVFGNSGPVPPAVGDTTTYTIMWQVKNYYSDVRNAKVKAVMPQNVELTGEIFPEQEISRFTFDSQSREIVWSVGDLQKGTGISKQGLTLAFQVAFTPFSYQRHQTAEIIREARITGEDSWTETTIEALAPAINTTLPDDPTITNQMGVVR
ncbi:MAG: hypothetical protein ACKKMR_02240 [Candidatus Nealsonbacteria bacterium]